MALWVCTGCTTAYSVGAPRCPHCQSTEHAEEGQPMAKNTLHGGPTNAAAEAEQAEGSDLSSVGTSSSTSSEKEQPSPEPSETPAPSPARTTASRSKKARTGSSSAAGTDGDPAADTSASDE